MCASAIKCVTLFVTAGASPFFRPEIEFSIPRIAHRHLRPGKCLPSEASACLIGTRAIHDNIMSPEGKRKINIENKATEPCPFI